LIVQSPLISFHHRDH